MEFRVEEVYEKEDFRELNHVVLRRRRGEKTVRRVLGLVLRAAAYGVAVFYLLTVLLMLCTGYGDTGLDMLLTGAPLLALAPLLLVLRSERVLAALSWRNYKEKGRPCSYRFCEDCFMVYTHVSDQRFYYPVIEAVLETGRAYYLFISANTAYILRKDSFTQGNPEDFRDFLARAAKKDVQFVKCGANHEI